MELRRRIGDESRKICPLRYLEQTLPHLTLHHFPRESQQLEDQQSIVPAGYQSNSLSMVTAPSNQFCVR